MDNTLRAAPGRIRDAIIDTMRSAKKPLSVKQIEELLSINIRDVKASSIRSYLRLNTPDTFIRLERGVYMLRDAQQLLFEKSQNKEDKPKSIYQFGRAKLVLADCFDEIRTLDDNSIHAVITDPPYGLHEYSKEQQEKLRAGNGGVWRIPPSFDGSRRSPLPRFTTLTNDQLEEIRGFFTVWGVLILQKMTPGANCIVASNPLVSHIVSDGLAKAGLERRGEIIRLTMTMRGGDRPKAAHKEFAEVSVMPRSMWEPWVVFRKPIEGRVQDNLRRWKTGGFRRPSTQKPFGDVIKSAPTRKSERSIAPHPSLKPQAFVREVVRAALPLGEGIICDPFAGAGSTLSAAEAVGYESLGIEMDPLYFDMAKEAIPLLSKLDRD